MPTLKHLAIAAATDKLYECWLLNCSINAQNPGGTISATGIAVTNGVVSITVQLDRQKPLGYINGELHIYGTDDLADDFSLISGEIVGISEGDSTFYTAPADGPSRSPRPRASARPMSRPSSSGPSSSSR